MLLCDIALILQSQEAQSVLLLTPMQETLSSVSILPLSLLRIDHPEQEVSLPTLLKPFPELAESDLYSPQLSPLPQDRDSIAECQFSFHSRLGSLEGKEETKQSEEEVEAGPGGVWGLRERQGRVMSQGDSDSEVVRGVEAARAKAVGTRAFGIQ